MKALFFTTLVISQITLATEIKTYAISGTLVHDTSSKHSFNKPLKITPKTAARITLCQYKGEDADCPMAHEIKLDKIKKLPIFFIIPSIIKQGSYRLRAEVRSQGFAGSSKAQVGDLTSEQSYEIDDAKENLKVKVFGLESCKDKNAGGFCL